MYKTCYGYTIPQPLSPHTPHTPRTLSVTVELPKSFTICKITFTKWNLCAVNLKWIEPSDIILDTDHQSAVPPNINLMTFSKSQDIKVMTLVFRPTKQFSWHSAPNVMILISWHRSVDILLKVNCGWRLRKIIIIHAWYLCLNGIDRHRYLIEM